MGVPLCDYLEVGFGVGLAGGEGVELFRLVDVGKGPFAAGAAVVGADAEDAVYELGGEGAADVGAEVTEAAAVLAVAQL